MPLYALLGLCLIVLMFGVIRRLYFLRYRSLLAEAPGWPFGPPRRLLRHALLQYRLLRNPKGLAHVALATGMAGLTIGTVLVAIDWDIVRPTGARLLKGSFYLGFEAFMDGLGILLVAGTLAALFRMWHRGEAAGRYARANAIVLWALLILGVGGFLLEGLRLFLYPISWGSYSFVGVRVAGLLDSALTFENAANLYHILWWSHAVVALGLLAALPFSSLLHALTVPLNVLVSRERPRADLPAPFDLRELIRTGDFDVRPGSSCLDDLDSGRLLSLLACTDCGRCDDVCPAHLSGTELSPRGMVGALRQQMDRGNWNTDLLQDVLSENALWACTTCAACVEACPALVAPLELVIPFRRELVSRQNLDRRQSEMLSALNRSFNPYGLPQADRATLHRSLNLPSPGQNGDPDYLYWIGCAGAYDDRVGKLVQATMGILTEAGLRVVVLGEEEICCGDPARRLGEEGLFQQLMLRNIEVLARSGARRIVTHCAHCFNALKNEYSRFGADLEVIHHSQLIADLLREGRLTLANSEEDTITFHDSCYMGRINGIYGAPRDALRDVPGLQVVELPRRQARSFCCGGGGAAFWYDVPARETPGTMRLREAAATGASYVGVSCPYCLKMLETSATSSGIPLPVKDVAEIVAAAMTRGNGESPDPDDATEGTGSASAKQVQS